MKSEEKIDTWTEILKGKKILSDKEAKEMKEDLKILRKEYGFRTIISH